MHSMEGILPINKPPGMTSFNLVRLLRKITNIQKIGHAGTLDPFATGVMIMLIGRNYTKLSDKFLNEDKEYIGRIHLGVETNTYDRDGTVVNTSDHIPDLASITHTLTQFQGHIQQIPPMFSAKKQQGKKLYELARIGKSVDRKPIHVNLLTEIISYSYPELDIRVKCSKGTYIRSIAHDLGQLLGCGAHLTMLTRVRSGKITQDMCFDGADLTPESADINTLRSKLINEVNQIV